MLITLKNKNTGIYFLNCSHTVRQTVFLIGTYVHKIGPHVTHIRLYLLICIHIQLYNYDE